MLEYIIKFSIRNKLIIILFTLSVAGFGIYAITQIPVGAVPDITNNQVQVITVSPNLSTQDVEQFITYPVELEMANLPGVLEIRSISKFGLSVVTIVFEDRMGAYLPRQLIAEKIKTASENIPEGFGTPEMGPISTGLGEIYQYILDSKPGFETKYTPMELRTIQDWVVKRQLAGIPGVVEINTWGGYLKQYEVAVSPEKLRAMDITVSEVFTALELNNSIAGGAYIEKLNESYFIRGEGLVRSLDDLRAIVVRNIDGIPVLIDDVAEVNYGFANRYGAITGNGEGEKVLGQIMMLKNANSSKVIRDVKRRVSEIQNTLPEGIYINPIVERSELISKTTTTITENLLLGCIIVVVVVILLLGNLRSGLVIASLIPLCLLFTISMMYILGIDANLMSLGAIDFGIIIDGAVIIVEYTVIRLTENQRPLQEIRVTERQVLVDDITFDATAKMMKSAIFGQFIILVVFIPILSLTGVEGKMFRPMALAFSFALIGAIFFCFTWLPVASSLFLKPEKQDGKDFSKNIMNYLYRAYCPVIRWSCDHKKFMLGLALAVLIFTGILFVRMGGEFVPTLDEGDFVIQPVLKTGTSLSKTIETTTMMENILLAEFPEVEQIVSRIGAAEVPTDPMSMEESDIIIKLKPKNEWVSSKSKDELANKFKDALSVIPGIDYEFTQPIEMRFNELITGVRADVAIKIFGDDIDLLDEKANEIRDLISGVEGAADVIVEKTVGLPQMSVTYDRKKLARYGLNIEDVNRTLSAGFGGAIAGSVFEGERRFDLVVRLDEAFRRDIKNLENLYIGIPDGSQVPLHALAKIEYTQGPAKISRENTRRRVVVSINVRNRDMQSVVEDVQMLIDENIELPSGYSISYGGQFENLRNATQRLKFAVPVAMLLIFILLHFAFRSFKEAILVFSAIPLAAIGGILLLWIRNMPFSISAGVGFIALFGVAVLNGIVMIEHLKELKVQGITDMRERILKGTRERLRPVMLTASAAAMGFLPMAVSTSAGAEVQRPLATVVIGGLITSTLLTMIALPLLYTIFDSITGIRLWPPRIIRGVPVVLLLLFPVYNAHAQTTELTVEDAVNMAFSNNLELRSYELQVMQSRSLIPTAFTVEKTNFFYGFDENNIAENGYPLKVIGVEQTFNFPTYYFAQKQANKVILSISSSSYEMKKRELEKNVRQSYFHLLFLLNQQNQYRYLDSIYSDFSLAADKRYETGETNYLEKLNARAKQAQIQMQLRQLHLDVSNAYEQLGKLLQIDSSLVIRYEPLYEIPVRDDLIGLNPGYAYFDGLREHAVSQLRIERNSWLPDFNLTYFYGTNQYDNAKNYLGYQIGIAIPVFFGSQAGRTRAFRLGTEIAQIDAENYRITLGTKIIELRNELKKYEEAISHYHSIGKELSAELLKTAKQSYASGEIDYFEYIKSLENANQIETDYLINLDLYNQTVLDLNYITL
ncbi:MAG: CusA/CzcA family heavy metal efflux RND transporter [Bacteroidales bacterium]|nr:CusA/CzcA family heavy metal efflux RND transporter [Bacteroidales bacterium]